MGGIFYSFSNLPRNLFFLFVRVSGVKENIERICMFGMFCLHNLGGNIKSHFCCIVYSTLGSCAHIDPWKNQVCLRTSI
jgi:hypothetical protein